MGLAALGLVMLAAGSGCSRSVECTSEVIAGAATYKATAHGKGEEAPVKKAALRDACQKMCVETKASMLDGCIARCTVDADAGKIGARTSCAK
jgi:hypothetical protein